MVALMQPLQFPRSSRGIAVPGYRARTRGGFTLIELLVALAVLGILMTLAVPSFGDFIKSNRLKTTAFDLVASLNYTRSEAIKRNADATLTPAAAGWSGGWSVQAAGQTFKIFDAPAGIQINPLADGAAWPGAVTFKRNGRPTGFTTMLFTVRLADVSDNRFVRCVLLDFGGDATIREDANHDGDCANG